MIKVLIKEKENHFNSLVIKGHANSAPYGKDLVCAGVTAIAIGGLNNLKDVKNFNIEIKEGFISVETIDVASEHDEIVMETIICGLKAMEEENADFIKIKKENF